MGCDIHCHIEVKINGRWEHWSAPDIDRNYSMFSRMAGVRARDGFPAIAEPRGLPSDPSIITEIDYFSWGSDAHSHSWLSGSEIEKVIGEFVEYAEARAKEVEAPGHSASDGERERAYCDRGVAEASLDSSARASTSSTSSLAPPSTASVRTPTASRTAVSSSGSTTEVRMTTKISRCRWCRFRARKRDEVYMRCEREAGHVGLCRAGTEEFYGGYVAKPPRGGA